MKRFWIWILVILVISISSLSIAAEHYMVDGWKVIEFKDSHCWRIMTRQDSLWNYEYRQEIESCGIKSQLTITSLDRKTKIRLSDYNNDGVPEREDLEKVANGDTTLSITWFLSDSLSEHGVVVDAEKVLLGKCAIKSVTFQPAPNHRDGHFSKDLDSKPENILTSEWFPTAFHAWLTASPPRVAEWKM